MVDLDIAEKGKGALLELAGEVALVESSVPAAPGSHLVVVVTAGARKLRLKVQRCVRKGQVFHIAGRLLDMTSDLRRNLNERVNQ